MQLPMFAPDSDWRPPDISTLPSWKGMKRIAIDCETRDPYLKKLGPSVRREGYIVGVSVTIEDTGESFYLPYRHQGGDNLPETEVLKYLKINAAAFTGQLVGAHLSYDLDYLWEEGIFFPNVDFYRDIQIAAPLIYELHFSYSLQKIGERYGIESKNEDLLRKAAAAYGIDPKASMWQLPARFVGPYAQTDTVAPLQILRKQEEQIEEHNLWNIWNLESKVLPILVEMRRRGVLIDQDKLAHIEEWSLDQEAAQLKIIKDATGIDVGMNNVWKAAALAPALEHIGIRLNKTKTGKPQIDKETLGQIDHPVAQAIARARKVNKLRTTFATSIRNYMVNGRVNCTLQQIAMAKEDGDTKGARYGRLSCVDPNLQQQPSRDDFAKMWRSIYIPEPGAVWGCLDYSQQEPRWTTHFAAKMGLRGAEKAAERYRTDPTMDNHQMMSDLTGLERTPAKDIFLGLCYGKGGKMLAVDLGLPTRWAAAFSGGGKRREVKYYDTRGEAMAERYEFEGDVFIWEAAGEEAQAILDKFDTKVPFVRELADAATKKAKQRGQVRTVGGRLLHFPQQHNGQFDFTHKALNRVIQGSSADQMKTAMVNVAAQMPDTFIQLQVHDELDGSFSSVEEARKVAKIMSECISDTLVPFTVDVEMGPSWGEMKDVGS